MNFRCSENHFQATGSPATSLDRTKSSFSKLNKTAEDSQTKVSAFYREQVIFKFTCLEISLQFVAVVLNGLLESVLCPLSSIVYLDLPTKSRRA